ncbi:MAG: CDP-diacylglycerol--serine O-phosphatidyltransferase [Luminiphilus sp.]|nr:CDP-diacylglycerol--serine O-phosphatidyltransferase [Luminiphilus sp.]
MTTDGQPPDSDELERAAEQIEAPLASLVGDYVEAEPGSLPQAKGIFLLPNLLTSGGLFCGFYSIIAGMQGDFYAGAVAILVAMIFDGLDGRVARLTHTSSAFGAQYDSLSDMVSFGLAPALLTFNWALTGLGKVGWVAAFVYAACAALRLARFNAHMENADASHFTGLASPAAAATAAASVWMGQTHGWTVPALDWAHALLLTTLGFLMIARFPYSSFKSISFDRRVPFVRMLLVVTLLGLIALDPPLVIWSLSVLYALSGPAQHLRRPEASVSGKGHVDHDKTDLH